MAPRACHGSGRFSPTALSRRGFLAASAALALGCRDRGTGELLVFAAASLREALTEAAAGRRGPGVQFNFAGSNDLARQLISAPRADVFISASIDWMDRVEAAHKLVPGSRRDLLGNQLVVIAHRDSNFRVDQPTALAKLGAGAVALGNPEAVPAGVYAKQWLLSVPVGDAHLWQALQDKVVPLSDVRAALAQVARRKDCIGIVYRSDVLHGDRVRVLYEVPEQAGPRIRYAAAAIGARPNIPAALQFLDHLASKAVGRVFERHGFTPLSGGTP